MGESLSMLRVLIFAAMFIVPNWVLAQSDPLNITTVTRPPFSMVENGQDTGFSIDLWRAIAEELGTEFEITRVDQFGDMLVAVENGTADGAIANISITADREQAMDFTFPIYASGLQILVPADAPGGSIWSLILRRDLMLAVLGAFAALWAAGMVMWALERRHQDYFNSTAKDANFPAFWWALNLVVNGGFEQLAPRSFLGRIIGTLMVVSSLFIVSIFVAKITATLTVNAINSNVSGINDLYDKRVGTIGGSTAAGFMDQRDLRFVTFEGLEPMYAAFEDGSVDALVFDAPILAYYVNTRGADQAMLVGNVFLPENYGMALPAGSALAEPINQALLRLRERGDYASIQRKWFGVTE